MELRRCCQNHEQ